MNKLVKNSTLTNTANQQSITKKTILIAEDEEINFQFLYALLHTVSPNIIRAHDGQEAVALCTTNKNIDVVLMDIGMPVMDGYQATTEIKKQRPNLPIIIQTAYSFPEETNTILSCGCDAHITKPIKRNLLINTLKEYL